MSASLAGQKGATTRAHHSTRSRIHSQQHPQPTESAGHRVCINRFHSPQHLYQQDTQLTGFTVFMASRIRNQHSQPKDLQAIGSTASGVRCQQGPQTTEFTANKIQSQQHPQPTASQANKTHSPHHPLPMGSAANKIYRRPLPYPTGSTANRVHSQRNPPAGTAA